MPEGGRKMPPEGIEPSTRFFRETCSATELRGHRFTLLDRPLLQPGPGCLVQLLKFRQGMVEGLNPGWVRHGLSGRGVLGRNPTIIRNYFLLHESLPGEVASLVHVAFLGNLLGENRADSRFRQRDGRLVPDDVSLLVADSPTDDSVVGVFPLPACPSVGQADRLQVDLIQEFQLAVGLVVARMKSPT